MLCNLIILITTLIGKLLECKSVSQLIQEQCKITQTTL